MLISWYSVENEFSKHDDSMEASARRSKALKLLWSDEFHECRRGAKEIVESALGWDFETKEVGEEDYERCFPHWSVDRTPFVARNCTGYLALLLRMNFALEARRRENEYMESLPHIGTGCRGSGCFYDQGAYVSLNESNSRLFKTKYDMDFLGTRQKPEDRNRRPAQRKARGNRPGAASRGRAIGTGKRAESGRCDETRDESRDREEKLRNNAPLTLSELELRLAEAVEAGPNETKTSNVAGEDKSSERCNASRGATSGVVDPRSDAPKRSQGGGWGTRLQRTVFDEIVPKNQNKSDSKRSLVNCSHRSFKLNLFLKCHVLACRDFKNRAIFAKKKKEKKNNDGKRDDVSIEEGDAIYGDTYNPRARDLDALTVPTRKCEIEKPLASITVKFSRWLAPLKTALRRVQSVIFAKDARNGTFDDFYLNSILDVYEFVKTYDYETETSIRESPSFRRRERGEESDAYYARALTIKTTLETSDNVELLYSFGLGFGVDPHRGSNAAPSLAERAPALVPFLYDMESCAPEPVFRGNRSLMIAVIYVVASCEKIFRTIKNKFPVSLAKHAGVVDWFGTSTSKSGAFPAFHDDEKGPSDEEIAEIEREDVDPKFARRKIVRNYAFERCDINKWEEQQKRNPIKKASLEPCRYRDAYGIDVAFGERSKDSAQRQVGQTIKKIYKEQASGQRTRRFRMTLEKHRFLLTSYRNSFLTAALYYKRCNNPRSPPPPGEDASSRVRSSRFKAKRYSIDGIEIRMDRDDVVPFDSFFPLDGTDSEGEESLIYNTQFGLPDIGHIVKMVQYWAKSSKGESAIAKAFMKSLPYRSHGRAMAEKTKDTCENDPMVFYYFKLILWLCIVGGYCRQYPMQFYEYEDIDVPCDRFAAAEPGTGGEKSGTTTTTKRGVKKTSSEPCCATATATKKSKQRNSPNDARDVDNDESSHYSINTKSYEEGRFFNGTVSISFYSCLTLLDGVFDHPAGAKRLLDFIEFQKIFSQLVWRENLIYLIHGHPHLRYFQPHLDWASFEHSTDFTTNSYRSHIDDALMVDRSKETFSRTTFLRSPCRGKELGRTSGQMYTENDAVRSKLRKNDVDRLLDRELHFEKELERMKKMSEIHAFTKEDFPSEITYRMTGHQDKLIIYRLVLKETISDLETVKTMFSVPDRQPRPSDEEIEPDGATLLKSGYYLEGERPDKIKPTYDEESRTWKYSLVHKSATYSREEVKQKMAKDTLVYVIKTGIGSDFPYCCTDPETGEPFVNKRRFLAFVLDPSSVITEEMVDHYLITKKKDYEFFVESTHLSKKTKTFVYDFFMRHHVPSRDPFKRIDDEETKRETLKRVLGKPVLKAYSELRSLYPDKMKPKAINDILEKMEVRTFTGLYYLFRMEQMAQSIKIIPIDKSTEDKIDEAMRTRRYGILEGKETLPESAYDVYLTPCCGKITTSVLPDSYGQNDISYNGALGRYVCNKKPKKKPLFAKNGGGGSSSVDKRTKLCATNKNVEHSASSGISSDLMGDDVFETVDMVVEGEALYEAEEEMNGMFGETAEIDDDDEDEDDDDDDDSEAHGDSGTVGFATASMKRSSARAARELQAERMGREKAKTCKKAEKLGYDQQKYNIKHCDEKTQFKIAKREKRKEETRPCLSTPVLILNLRGKAMIYKNKGKTSGMYGHCPICAQFHEMTDPISVGFSGYCCPQCKKNCPENYAIRKCSYCGDLIPERQYELSIRIPMFDVYADGDEKRAITRKPYCHAHAPKKYDYNKWHSYRPPCVRDDRDEDAPEESTKKGHDAYRGGNAARGRSSVRGGRRGGKSMNRKLLYDSQLLPDVFSDLHDGKKLQQKFAIRNGMQKSRY
jgi:hypothetical protein